MENLKKILNVKSHVFCNFQFSQHIARNHLVCAQIVFQIRNFVKFLVEELNGEVYFDLKSILTCLNHFLCPSNFIVLTKMCFIYL